MKILYALFIIFLTFPLFGQDDISPEAFRIHLNSVRLMSNERNIKIKVDSFDWDQVSIHYLTAKEPEQISSILGALSDEDFPFVLLRENALAQLKVMIPLYDNYYKLGEKYRRYTEELEELHGLELQQLQVVSDLQNQRIERYKVLSDSLYQDVLAMSKLADQYRDEGEKAIRGQNMSKIWSGVLGGAIGFLAGIAIFDDKK